MNVEGHCFTVAEMYLDKICNLIGWRGMTTEDQGIPGTDSELVTSLLVYLARTQPEVRVQRSFCRNFFFSGSDIGVSPWMG